MTEKKSDKISDLKKEIASLEYTIVKKNNNINVMEKETKWLEGKINRRNKTISLMYDVLENLHYTDDMEGNPFEESDKESSTCNHCETEITYDEGKECKDCFEIICDGCKKKHDGYCKDCVDSKKSVDDQSCSKEIEINKKRKNEECDNNEKPNKKQLN